MQNKNIGALHVPKTRTNPHQVEAANKEVKQLKKADKKNKAR